ncbi:hypothetical protein B0J13DRAFT_83331 [Dactylonectria estremocensis]|uniref:Uncharacterized protein n=1 Tax=Dactylonectria estremocensis TaxID=1079267 RepID=A0A9P9EI06_9HYPO|nr:hypothetical protein B0J13DRAFT_83331 [Dactylonectria estremocensis]
MASVTFNQNFIITSANSAVDYIDLGFASTNKLNNNTTTTSAVSGSSRKAVVHFNGNNPPPLTFKVTKEVTFPEDSHVTLTGGGPNDNVIEGVDDLNNRAVWSIV